MQPILVGLIAFILFAFGLIFVFLGLRLFRSDGISDRLKEYVDDASNDPKRWGRRITAAPRELSGSLFTRLLVPLIRGIGRLLGRLTPAGVMEQLEHQLVVAGYPYGLGVREMYGIMLGSMMLGLILAFFILRQGINMINALLSIAAILGFYVLPRFWLRGRVGARQNIIRRNLPDALDMLSVCATAGLGFDQAMQRVSEHWDTPLSAELGRVISEMEMGLSRRDAMRNLAERTDVTELSSFVALILQADQLGMSISDTLQAIAEQMRIDRRYRAQEMAQKVPTKMMFPLAFLIFPALLAIILGPAVPILLDVFRGLQGR